MLLPVLRQGHDLSTISNPTLLEYSNSNVFLMILFFCGSHNFLNAITSSNIPAIPLMSNVCCVFDSHWWIGLVVEIDSIQSDLKINFFHLCGPSRYFHWPSREDMICWVPTSHVLCKIDQPKLISAAATMRSASLKYKILESEHKSIKKCYENFKF